MDELDTIKTAIINGKEVLYDACSINVAPDCEFYKKLGWKWLGAGYIYSINGIMQEGVTEVLGFWKKKKKPGPAIKPEHKRSFTKSLSLPAKLKGFFEFCAEELGSGHSEVVVEALLEHPAWEKFCEFKQEKDKNENRTN